MTKVKHVTPLAKERAVYKTIEFLTKRVRICNDVLVSRRAIRQFLKREMSVSGSVAGILSVHVIDCLLNDQAITNWKDEVFQVNTQFFRTPQVTHIYTGE